jgi:hypothetical protein
MRIIACIEYPVVMQASAPARQSAPGAAPVATGPVAACAGLKRFTQRRQFNRILP